MTVVDTHAAVDSRRAWEVVLQHIEADLLAGRLVPGDHLPAERALSSELGVGRSSVREALRVLEVLGLIRTQTGSGPQSGAIIVARPSGGMSSLMRLQVAAQGFDVRDVVKTRLVLEAAVVTELAEASATALESAPLDLGDAVRLLDAMDADGQVSEAEFLTLDAAFHLALADLSGNTVIASMMAGLRNSIESYVLAGVPNLRSWAETSGRLRHEHRAIVAAIESGDAESARDVVNAHITGYYAETNFISTSE
ncbi:FadR/GntR family transcriptional regulator [Agreia bicolorata]|uniref:FadR/GntR family transcriptional regulator n=1 Tax=Agreia bicolorata TaxID=110935 RepID=UPI0005C87BC1|nr:FCD domain-containing protein [Agreia bicolorata]